MSKVYCGIGKCPKGARYGSMKECADQKQIRRFGAYKVDSRILNAKSEDANNEVKRKEAMMKIALLRGKINKITKDMVYERDPQKKKEMIKQLAQHKKDLRETTTVFSKLEKLRKK
jgi:hypothetical protein